jgi:hypothetical protein
MVLAKDAAEIAHTEEDRSAAVVALDTGLLAEVWCDSVHLDVVADETHARRLVAVDAAQSGAEVAVAKVGISFRALLGCVH